MDTRTVEFVRSLITGLNTDYIVAEAFNSEVTKGGPVKSLWDLRSYKLRQTAKSREITQLPLISDTASVAFLECKFSGDLYIPNPFKQELKRVDISEDYANEMYAAIDSFYARIRKRKREQEYDIPSTIKTLRRQFFQDLNT